MMSPEVGASNRTRIYPPFNTRSCHSAPSDHQEGGGLNAYRSVETGEKPRAEVQKSSTRRRLETVRETALIPASFAPSACMGSDARTSRSISSTGMPSGSLTQSDLLPGAPVISNGLALDFKRSSSCSNATTKMLIEP